MVKQAAPPPRSPDAAGEKPAGKRPKAAKKAIKTTVAVHDRTQLETVFDYYLLRGLGDDSSAKDQASLSYRVDAYLFYPRQFALNEFTYPKDRFFADVRPLLRFREPKFGYKTMLGTKPGANSPLIFLDQYLRSFEAGLVVEPLANAVAEVRLFACAFVSSFLRSIGRSRRRLAHLAASREPAAEELAKVCGRMLRQVDRAHQVLQTFRALLPRAQALPEALIGALVYELQLIDEYCYYRLRDGIAFLWNVAHEVVPADSSPQAGALRQRLGELLALHDAHAEACGYMRPGPSSSSSDKERYLYRRGELKRRIWEVLFLDMRSLRLFALQRQVGAMIAAGAASVWALVAQFLLVRQAMQPRNLADIVGLSGMLFLALGTLAYIIKDRIKEWGKIYFRGALQRVPDHSERLFYKNRSGEREDVGALQETARFIKLTALPLAVRKLREATSPGDLTCDDSAGTILQYTKVITLSRKLRILNHYPLRAVHDILRINIDACLPRLGEPTVLLDVVNAAGKVEAVRFPKVYYLDLVLGYARLSKGKVVGPQSLDYVRLVLDKTGLLRIERLN